MSDENQFVTFGSDVAWPLSTPEKKVCVRCEGNGYNDDDLASNTIDCWICDGLGEHNVK